MAWPSSGACHHGNQQLVGQQMMECQVEGIVMASATLSSTLARECAQTGISVVLLELALRIPAACSHWFRTGPRLAGVRLISAYPLRATTTRLHVQWRANRRSPPCAGGSRVFPELLAVAIAQGDVAPGPARNVHEGTILKSAGQCCNRRVDEGVFGVGVQNGRTQCINRCKGISAHPHQMRGIKICTHVGADRLAQAQQGWHIVDQLIAVHFHGQFFTPCCLANVASLSAALQHLLQQQRWSNSHPALKLPDWVCQC